VTERNVDVVLEPVGLVTELDSVARESDIVQTSILDATGDSNTPDVEDDLAIRPSSPDCLCDLDECQNSEVVSLVVIGRTRWQRRGPRVGEWECNIVGTCPNREVSQVTLTVSIMQT
jgi:hypothetical protein